MKRFFFKHLPVTLLKVLLAALIGIVSVPLMVVDVANGTDYFGSVWKWLEDFARDEDAKCIRTKR